MFELFDVGEESAVIKVVGVGGGGGNAINSMISSGLKGVDFIAMNTDLQTLSISLARQKVQLGSNLTKGLGAGSNPDIGREAALEDIDSIKDALYGADMVFITAGMGGGTGTGASPVVAQVAREMGILTVGVVTKPFFYEGRKRLENAMRGINELKDRVDVLIVIPNDKVRMLAEKGTPLFKAFDLVNNVLRQAVQGISDLILKPGLINLDFADVRTVMKDAGRAVMGVGSSRGEQAGIEAAKRAISNPLLEDASIDGAKRVLLNITGGNLTMDAVDDACKLVYESVHKDVHLILGAVIDEEMGDEVRVTVVATDFEKTYDGKLSDITEDSGLYSDPSCIPQEIVSKEVSVNKSYGKKEVLGIQRVISKSIYTDTSLLPRELLDYNDPVDIPAFIRRFRERVHDTSEKRRER